MPNSTCELEFALTKAFSFFLLYAYRIQESFVEIKEASSAAGVPEAVSVKFLEDLLVSFDSQGARTCAADTAWYV